METSNLLQRVYDATRDGLDIIRDIVDVDDAVINSKKAFRLRKDERTPSAYLYPPRGGGDCWHVHDFGMGDGEGHFSPIDLYMRDRGYTQAQFTLAVHELAERYGVRDTLQQAVNKPILEQRPALAEEVGQPPRVECREGFTDEELRTWGPCVKAEHLTELGWRAVASVQTTKDGKTTIKRSTPTYPIFIQDCLFADVGGVQKLFQKLYEPKNYDKRYRFSSIGEKPKDYVFGLNALRSKFLANNEEKLDCVVLVSGGSDAANCLSMGYQPVWLNSETANLSEQTFRTLQTYAKRVVLIADFDETGRETARRVALRFPQLYTVWFTTEDMGGLHDFRNNLRKDLKDYILLHPHRKDMEQLLKRARKARFAEYKTDSKGGGSYIISETALTYFLWLNGYSQMKDDNEARPRYIHEENGIVRSVAAKDIHDFLKQWGERQGCSELLMNTLMKSCRAMITDATGHLTMRDDLDFSSATSTSQTMYFDNCKVLVTAEGITHQPYSAYTGGHYVWQDSVIHHAFRAMKPMFTWEKVEDHYVITFTPEAECCKMARVVRNMARLHWRKVDEQGLTLTPEEVAEEMQALLVIMLILGYLLHRHKSPSAAYAALLLDYALSGSVKERNGRSGKTFLLKAVGRLLNMEYIDMTTLSKKSNQQFGFSRVKESTGMVIIDECPEHFAFEELYAMVSDDMEVEGKGKNPVVIPFSRAPKFGIATNHTLTDHSPSSEGRFAPVVVGDFYHVQTKSNDYRETRQISDTFGQNLQDSEYADTDWAADIYFMLECLQMYLSLPVKDRRQMPPMGHIERRELQAAIGDQFRQWADENLGEGSEFLDNETVKLDDLFNMFVHETSSKMSQQTFTKRLKDWCVFAPHIACYNPASITGQAVDGARWQKRVEGSGKRFNYCYLQSVGKAAEMAKVSEVVEADLFPETIEQTEVPF